MIGEVRNMFGFWQKVSAEVQDEFSRDSWRLVGRSTWSNLNKTHICMYFMSHISDAKYSG